MPAGRLTFADLRGSEPPRVGLPAAAATLAALAKWREEALPSDAEAAERSVQASNRQKKT